MKPPRVYGQSELGHSIQNVALAFSLYIAGQAWGDEAQAKAEKREVIPLHNFYDADVLLNLGYGRGEGGIEHLAVQAHAAGQKGIVAYTFALDRHFGTNTRAFNEYQKVALERPDRSARDIVAEIIQRHATGQLTLSMALSAATGVVAKRWRDEIKEWDQNLAFHQQRNENAAKEFDARNLAERMFLHGGFNAFAAVLMDARPVFINLWQRYPPTIRLARGASPSVKDGEAVNSRGQSVPAKIATHKGFVAYSVDASQEARKDLGVKGR